MLSYFRKPQQPAPQTTQSLQCGESISFPFAGCTSQLVVANADTIKLTFENNPFSQDELKILAQKIHNAIKDKFEFPLVVSADNSHISLHADRSTRSRPLFLKISLQTIKDELLQITDDREKPLFLDLESSLELLRREVCLDRQAQELAPLILAKVEISGAEAITHLCVGKVFRKLRDDAVLDATQPLICEQIDNTTNEAIIIAKETIADRIDRETRENSEDSTSAPIERLELPKEFASSNLIPTPQEEYSGKFDLAHITLEAIFFKLETEGYLPDLTIYADAITRAVEDAYEEIFEMIEGNVEE